MQLPPELRRHIWYFYCPDLSAKARALEFTLKESDAPTTPSDHFSLKTDPTLASQTRSLRAMLSTHRESRSIAVRIFPDELALDMDSTRAIVRFRKESDVVFLMAFTLDVNYVPFATQVQNLAVGHVCPPESVFARQLEEAGLEVRSMVKFESDDSNRRYHRSESERVDDDEVIELRNQSEQEPGRHRTLSISEFDIVDVSAELDTELQERLRKRYAIVVDPDEHGENETGHA
ncbi:hypothetical protein E4U48_003506 [Claviceps purpurea]|nr:hypothetical protein E4U48_003506 [Claviceps purpurea]